MATTRRSQQLHTSLVLAALCLPMVYVGAWAPDSVVVYPLRADASGHVISSDVSNHYHTRQHHERTRRSLNDNISSLSSNSSSSLPPSHNASSPSNSSSLPPSSSSLPPSSSSLPPSSPDTTKAEETPLENLYIVINNDDEELFLNLRPNTRLLTSHTVIEWVLGDGTSVIRKPREDCFYVGTLNAHQESLVAISNCDGLRGYIQTGNDSYFIEPLEQHEGGGGGGGGRDDDLGGGTKGDHPQPHLIYKVKSITSRLNLSLQQDQEFGQQDGEEEHAEGREVQGSEVEVKGEEEDNETVDMNPEEKVGKRKGGRGGGGRNIFEDNLELHTRWRHTKKTPKFRKKQHNQTDRRGTKKEEEDEEEDQTFPEFIDFFSKRRRRRRFVREREAVRATVARWRLTGMEEDVAEPKFMRNHRNSPPKFIRPRPELQGEDTATLLRDRDDNNNLDHDNNDSNGSGSNKENGNGGANEIAINGGNEGNASNASKTERVGRSALNELPKFSRRHSSSFSSFVSSSSAISSSEHDSERSKREDSTVYGEGETEVRDGGGVETDGGEDNKKKRRKNRSRKRGRCKKIATQTDTQEGTDGAEGKSGKEEKCRRRERRKLSKIERERRREERRAKRNQEKEKKRREKQRKRQEKREKRERRKGKRKMGESLQSSVPKERGQTGDPLDGHEWQGYSPDLFWEMQTAAGWSGGGGGGGGGGDVVVETAPRWLELVVAVDHTVIAFHGDDNVERYVFTLFNIVSAIYEDPSLESSLELVMLRIIFYKDKKHSQVRAGLAKRSLEAVNRWSERLHRLSDPRLQHDMAVWLTRTDLGGPSGYAPVSGVCDPPRSCTLNRDEGLTSAFIIAHEMGHVLGLSHDGDAGAGNTCEDEGYSGSVMAPLVAATFTRFHWSSCSKAEYHSRAGDWSCLLNKPEWENATTVSSTITYQYSLDDQCRMEFGEGYGLCGSLGLSDPCTHLWCSNASQPYMCKTKKGPPLEGTTCGPGKWCRHGFCESMGRGDGDDDDDEESDGESPVRHNPRDGGWGPWGSWGPCSATCGTGVAFRTRTCDNPTPAWGGRRCSGKREEWRICGTEECPLPRLDPRAQHCHLLSSFAHLDPRRAALTWWPYEPKSKRKKCRVSCYSHATNEVYIGREAVVDGTPCSYDNQHNICVQGKCIVLGCDHVVGSRAREDECGECGGNGATCSRHHKHYLHTPTPREYTMVTHLPAGARNIQVKEAAATPHFIALQPVLAPFRPSTSRPHNAAGLNASAPFVFLLNGAGTQEPPKNFIGEGTRFHYSDVEGREVLQARGPLLRPLSLLVWGSGSEEAIHVEARWVTRPEEEHYQWEVGPYTACSVTCGGGQQHQTLVCRDRRSDLQVFHDRCAHLPRPDLNTTTCNTFGCGARWVTGVWEHCSTTCGPSGVQARQVACVSLTYAALANWTAGMVPPEECAPHEPPTHSRPCMREPCPAHWIPLAWTPCSVTCGSGLQERTWECVGGGGNEVTYDCGSRPHEVRGCPDSPPCPTAPCLRDTSEFCQLPVLHRYCTIPKYKELCCHTCANVL